MRKYARIAQNPTKIIHNPVQCEPGGSSIILAWLASYLDLRVLRLVLASPEKQCRKFWGENYFCKFWGWAFLDSTKPGILATI